MYIECRIPFDCISLNSLFRILVLLIDREYVITSIEHTFFIKDVSYTKNFHRIKKRHFYRTADQESSNQEVSVQRHYATKLE